MTQTTALSARPAETYSWWAALNHGGLLIAPARLLEFFPPELPPLPRHVEERLRRDVTHALGGDREELGALLDTVLEAVLDLDRTGDGRWLKGNEVPREWSHRAATGEMIKPRRLWEGPHGASLPVFVDGQGTRLGLGRGRRPAARVVEWLRRADRKVALLTNGRQWRLVHAGPDHDAFAEWETTLWFEGGRAAEQVTALRILLGRDALVPAADGEPPRLEAAIEASRRGQAELSRLLGERVRQAVELLIREHSGSLAGLDGVTPRVIYLAATRVVMRMVVILFAEARDLLPRDNPLYHSSYGLQGLREELDHLRGAAADRLRHRAGAWPRVLALFRLVYQGSPHPALPVPRYGGSLFAPGDLGSPDPTARALGAFEDPEHAPDDGVVQQVLDLLCRTHVKVRLGRRSTWVPAPVDFSDLSSEYIGMLYEGLLDFELRRAPSDDPVVFLNLGDQPALPLSRLEQLDDRALANLVATFRKSAKRLPTGEGTDDEDADELEDAEAEEADGADAAETDAPEEEAVAEGSGEAAFDARGVARGRAEAWALRAVKAGRLVPKPRVASAKAESEYDEACRRAAEVLIARVVLPGEWYLVRWGGTRKGSGSFYTPMRLAYPTVERTLRPLAYDPPRGADGHPDEAAPPLAWTPKRPEEILGLRVCDPAVGSGSFLVAALRFLTRTLQESLYHHDRIRREGDKSLVALLEGRAAEGRLADEVLPCPPDADDFEPRLMARLKRYVVERCLYGVDIDPLAVELARLSLWVETLDRDLPFTFLDHKIRVGNSLVGCWFDRFQDYPALAWERKGGDQDHTRGVHFAKEAWTKAIRDFRDERIKPELAEWVEASGPQFRFDFVRQAASAKGLHDEALAALEEMHTLPPQASDERALLYDERISGNPAWQRLKEAFDTWCSIWFWPADRLEDAPTPLNFADPPEETRALVRALALEHRFFHWELEFPDVFSTPGAGFDAIVGNPPWEIQKPNSREFFSNLDPLYRAYGKQEALDKQAAFFTRSAEDERAWLRYSARFAAMSNWCGCARYPWGDPEDASTPNLHPHKGRGSKGRNLAFHALWRELRAGRSGYADPEHPFRHQGSADINSYKMFLEQGHSLLHPGGILGLVVPSGIYTDKGATDLRRLMMDRCGWRWLFGFENRDGIFDIDSRYKFCPVVVQKASRTDSILTAFMRRDLADWENGERHAIPYGLTQVRRFSPRTLAILEVGQKRDLEVLEKIYANSVLLGDDSPDGWGVRYNREFDMTNDSALFHPRPSWEAEGYRPDEYGRWLLGRWRKRERGGPASPDRPRWEAEPGVILSRDGTEWIHESDIQDIALPLYEGRMIGQFDFSEKGWVSGKGRSAVWREVSWGAKVLDPQYLMAASAYEAVRPTHGNREHVHGKLVHMSIGSATNTRTMISAIIPNCPCGHSIRVLYVDGARSGATITTLAGLLNSLAYDYQLRTRLGGLNLDYFVLAETPLYTPAKTPIASLAHLVLRLVVVHPWLAFRETWGAGSTAAPALTAHERLRLRCMLDAIAAELYGLDRGDLGWILRDCDHPAGQLRDPAFTRGLDSKGFWRVDKDKDPELRHTVLTLAAFRDLKEIGLEAFCNLNGGEGWMLPETLCLADLGLGHDARARRPQPVRERLGERFLPWQLEQTPEVFWKECELHARNLLGEAGYNDLMAGISTAEKGAPVPPGTVGGSRRGPRGRDASDGRGSRQQTLFDE